MAKKKSGAADAGGGSKGNDKKAPKPTSVSRLVPDPEDIKHDVNRLLGALRAPNKSMSRGDAALFLWDIALNNKNERARLSMEDVAVAAVAAMRKGDHLARSAAASLLAKTSEWKEARAHIVAAGAPRELCATLLDTGDRVDTDLARRAAVAALRRLAATGDLRAAMSPQLHLRALVDAARPNPNELARAAETPAHWETRADALEILHACMDPARNPDAAPVRASVAGEGVPGATLRDAVDAFAAAARHPSSPPPAVAAAVWCLADLAADEHRREEMCSNAELLGTFVATLRDDTGVSLEPKAAAAAALCRLAAAAPPKTEADLAAAALARKLEWDLGAVKPEGEEFSAKDVEERAEWKARLDATARTSNEALVGPATSEAETATMETRTRIERVLAARALGPLCRLAAPPGFEPVPEPEEEEEEEEEEEGEEEEGEEGDGDEEEGGSGDEDEGGSDDGDGDGDGDDGDGEDDDGDGDGDDGDDDGAGEDEKVPPGDGDSAAAAAAASASAPKKKGKKKGKKGKKGKKKKGPKALPGQKEAYLHATAALRRLSLDPSAREKMRALRAHEYLLWHVKNSAGGARRNAEATLARLATSETTKADLTALDAPGYVTGAKGLLGVTLEDLAPDPATAATMATRVPGLAELSHEEARRRKEEALARATESAVEEGKRREEE